jgi:hypothetical protein
LVSFHVKWCIIKGPCTTIMELLHIMFLMFRKKKSHSVIILRIFGLEVWDIALLKFVFVLLLQWN